MVFGVWLRLVSLRPLAHPVLYPHYSSHNASPKAISERTSYLQVRLAYHPYPHVIAQFCNIGAFGPPRGISLASACTWVAHLVSCLIPATPATRRLLTALLRLAFAAAPSVADLTWPLRLTRWLILQKARRHTLATSVAHSAPTGCKHTVSGSISLPLPGVFSPFPHGTCSLSVIKCI